MPRRVGLVVAVSLAACGAREAAPSREVAPVAAPTQAPAPTQATTPSPATAQAAAPAPRPVVWVDDPAALAVVAASGGAFTDLISAGDERVFEAALADDVASAGRGDPAAGVGVQRFSHRLFDTRWLAPRGGYQLITVDVRPDRLPFTDGTCGEIRLIYRLAYQARVSGQDVSSRLPMTALVILRGEPRAPGCAAAARRWMAPGALAGDALGRWLVDGPLAGVLTADRVEEVFTDTQVMRWPSAVRPDLGGHAEYALRSFRRRGGALASERLDNTPDVARLRGDRGLRDELLAWLAAPGNLDAVDAGLVRLPDRFLAERAVSVTPRGLARRANRPFRQIFAPADVASLPLAGRRHIGSPEALLRRLDDLSCQGCHQSHAIAGFHTLGVDGADVVPGNALAVSRSPHAIAEIARRERLVEQLSRSDALDVAHIPALARPPALRPDGDAGGYGAPCGLGDPGFAAWTCAPGLTCDRLDAPADDDAVGACMPEVAAIGDPCEVAPLVASADFHRDRAGRAKLRPCGPLAVCNTNHVGFPGGMCTATCDDLPAGAACGAIAQLAPFNACLARKVPFPTCLSRHVSPAGMRACSETVPCRDDYVCSRTADGGGACTPPYFLFQLRVDGHP